MGKKYAGFGLRFIAYIIDIAILSLLYIGLLQLSFIVGISEVFSGLIAIILGWMYFSLMESSPYHGTVGKIAVGIIVTDEREQSIFFSRASGRFFGKFISTFILFIGYVMIIFTEKKQGLHDMIAGCLVLKKH